MCILWHMETKGAGQLSTEIQGEKMKAKKVEKKASAALRVFIERALKELPLDGIAQASAKAITKRKAPDGDHEKGSKSRKA